MELLPAVNTTCPALLLLLLLLALCALAISCLPRLLLCCVSPQADEVEGSVDPDAAQPLEPRSESEPSTSYSSSSSSGSGGAEQQAGLARRPKSALRRYVESFDQETMMETARWVGGRGTLRLLDRM